jgi:branched-chain amino acid transport system permease protein
MTDFLQGLIDAASLGSLYALVALGIALIFGIMRLINFAHGDLVMVGGYMMLALAGQPWPVLVLGAVLVPMFVALAMDRLVFRFIRDTDPATLLIASFALSVLLQNVVSVGYTPTATAVALPGIVTESFQIGELRVAKLSVFTIVGTVMLLSALAVGMSRTSWGVQMRAAAQDFVMARLIGVRANLVIALAFGLSGLLAGMVALSFVAQTGTVTPTLGVQLAAVGFVAVVLGGMGSISAAAAGGFLLGAATILLQSFLPLELRPYRDVFVFAAVIAVLVLRPQGLFLGREGERV